MNTHVIYEALINKQPLAYKIGHQFNYFLRKGVRKLISDFLITTARMFWPIFHVYLLKDREQEH